MDGVASREKELGGLKDLLAGAAEGRGATVIMSGSAGMGKSWLAERFTTMARADGFNIICSQADPNLQKPFDLFSEAAARAGLDAIFEDSVTTGFDAAFLVDGSGRLIADASSGTEGPLGSDNMANMLAAVQAFVRDSFDGGHLSDRGLGRLDYGEMKVLIEHGDGTFLAGIFAGDEHAGMRGALNRTMAAIKAGESQPRVLLSGLMDIRFPVHRNLEGIKLEAERLRVADRLKQALWDLSGKGRFALVLEDIHWADESSLFTLRYIARNVSDRPIIILATARPEDSKSITAFLDQIIQDGACREIMLGGISDGEVAGLVEETLPGHALPSAFLADIERRTGGNPFFIREILNHLVDVGAITRRECGFALENADYSIPGSIGDVVLKRLDRLEPGELSAAEFLSCAGLEFDADLPGSSRIVVNPAGALETLQRIGMVILDSGRGKFAHAIFQEVIYGNIAPRWISAYHQDIGEILETKEGDTDTAYAIARHFSKSNVHSKTLKYCMIAGETAEASLAFEQAITFYNTAMEARRKVKIAEAGEGSERDLSEKLGRCYSIVSNFEMAVKHYKDVLALEADKVGKAKIWLRLTEVYERRGDYAATVEACGEGLALLGNESPRERIPLMLMQAGAMARTGRAEEGMAIAEESLRLATGLGDKSLVARSLHIIGSLNLLAGNFPKAIESLSAAVDIWNELGNIRGASGSLNNLGVSYYYIGDIRKSMECYETSLEVYKKVGDKYGVAAILNNLGGFTQDYGNLEKALEYHRESLEIKKAIGDKYGIVSTLTNMGIVQRNLGNLDRALEIGMEGLALATEINNAKEILLNVNNIGEAHLEAGNLDLANERYLEALRLCDESKDQQQKVHSLKGLAKVASLRGSDDEAEDYARRAVEVAISIESPGEEGRARTVLGMILARSGRTEEAKKEFSTARDLLMNSSKMEEDSSTDFEEGMMYLGLGETGKAVELLKRARAGYDARGYGLMTGRIDKILSELG